MNIITQEARRRQAVVKLALRKGKSFASRMYGVSLSSVKRWCKRYDGTWQSLVEGSHRPKSHPKRHTKVEEEIIRKRSKSNFFAMAGTELTLRQSKPDIPAVSAEWYMQQSAWDLARRKKTESRLARTAVGTRT